MFCIPGVTHHLDSPDRNADCPHEVVICMNKVQQKRRLLQFLVLLEEEAKCTVKLEGDCLVKRIEFD